MFIYRYSLGLFYQVSLPVLAEAFARDVNMILVVNKSANFFYCSCEKIGAFARFARLQDAGSGNAVEINHMRFLRLTKNLQYFPNATKLFESIAFYKVSCIISEKDSTKTNVAYAIIIS